MDLREGAAVLRRGWWIVLVGLVLGGAAGAAASLVQTPIYTSTTQLFVSTSDASSVSALSQGSQFSQERVASYAELITGNDVSRLIVKRLGLSISPDEVAREVSATPVANTVLIDVSVADPSARRANAIAGAIGTEFPAYADRLEASTGSGASPVKVTVTQQPVVAVRPSSPNIPVNTGLGALVGMFVGAGVVLARSVLDRSIRDADAAAEAAGVVAIGTVVRDEALATQHVVDKKSGSRTAEDYRQLRNNLQFLSVDEPPKVIMVSSALPAEGKTTLVINLALALSEAGSKVTVVEADLRRPKITRYLGMVGGVGLTNVLAGTSDAEEVMQQYRDNFSVIPAGPNPPNPGELLASSHMAVFLEKLRASSDYVLIDAPPLLPVADASGLAVHTDGVLLSIRYGSTRKDQLHQAAVTLDRVGARILGVVLNIVPPKAEMAGAYGYGYDYGYGDGRHAL